MNAAWYLWHMAAIVPTPFVMSWVQNEAGHRFNRWAESHGSQYAVDRYSSWLTGSGVLGVWWIFIVAMHWWLWE